MRRFGLILLLATFASACASTRPAPLPGDRPTASFGQGGDRGLISFYADSLAGNAMANGKPYNPNSAICAHRTYPFGTTLEVTLDEGGSASCVVSDRGPFVRGRILDVSKRVARELGLIQRGVARGRITVVR